MAMTGAVNRCCSAGAKFHNVTLTPESARQALHDFPCGTDTGLERTVQDLLDRL